MICRFLVHRYQPGTPSSVTSKIMSITYAIAVFVAVDDHCFHSCWKFLVNQTQVLLNLLVLMSRKYIRHYIFWTRILKRTVRLKLNDIDSFDTVMILLFAINELDLNLVLVGPFSIVM